MKIKVTFAESIARLLGRSEMEIDFGGRTLEDLLEKLAGDNPGITDNIFPGKEASYTCSINEEVVLDTKHHLKDGDEVFIFLPVAGG